MTNGIRAQSFLGMTSGVPTDFSITSSYTPTPISNSNWYNPYTPPYIYHPPQPPENTPQTPPLFHYVQPPLYQSHPTTHPPYTPYLAENQLPLYQILPQTTHPYYIDSHPPQATYAPSVSPSTTATLVTQSQPEMYAPQVIDESPVMLRSMSDATRNKILDSCSQMIKTLDTMTEICKGICSKPVGLSSSMSTRISAVDNSPVRNENVEDDSVSVLGGNVVLGSGDASDGVEGVRRKGDSENWSVLKERDEDEGFNLFKEIQESVKEGEENWATAPLWDLDNEEVDDVDDMSLFGYVVKMFDGSPERVLEVGTHKFDVSVETKYDENQKSDELKGNVIEDNVSEVVTLQTTKTSALVNEPRCDVGKSNAFNFDPGGDISDVSLIEVKMKDAGTHLGLLYCGDQRLDIVALGIENVNGVIFVSEIDVKDMGVMKMALEVSPVVGEECKEEECSAFVSSCCVGADNVIVASSVFMQVEDVGIITGTTIKSSRISPYYVTTDASLKSYKRVESKNSIEGVSAEHGNGSQIADNGSIFVRNVVYNGTEEAGGMIETNIKAQNSLQNMEENGDTKWNVREWVADNIKVGDSQVNPDFFFPGLGCTECRASSIRCEAIYQTYRRNDPRGDPARIIDVQGNVKSLIRTEPHVIANFHVDVALSTVVRAVMLVKNVNEVILLDVTPLSIELVTLGGVIGFREFLLSFCATRGSLSLNINISTMIIQLELVGLIIFNQKVMDLTKRIWCLDLELSGSNMVAVLCNMGPYLSKLMGSYETGFQVASKEGVLTGEGMRYAYFEACEVVPHTHTLQISVGQETPTVMTVIHASQRYAKLYLWNHVYLAGIQASEQVVLERIHTGSNLCQNPGHMSEEMQKPGTQGNYFKAIVLFVNVQFNFREAALLSFEKCFVMAVVRTGVEGSNLYDFLNDGCMILEVIKNSVDLGAELDGLDWTLDYVKVNVLNVEVVQIMKAYKYNVWGQGSPEMEKDFLTMEELCKSISFDRAIAYGDVFQAAISSGEESKVQELLLLDVTPLSLGIVMTSVVIVFILRNTTVPTKKKQVLSTYCDDQPGVMVHVFKYEGTIIEDHKLLVMFDFSGTQFIAKRIALSWYWYVTKLVFDPGNLVTRRCLQIGFILEDKDDFKREVLLRIGPV